MSWGTDFTYNVYISHKTFTCKEDVEQEIASVEESIRISKERILMFASSTPNAVIPQEWQEEAVRFIHTEVGDLLQEIMDDVKLLTKLEMLRNHYDENE